MGLVGWLALTFGALVMTAGLIVVAVPRRAAVVVERFVHWPSWFGVAVVVRVSTGTVFLLAAPASRWPNLASVIGVALVAAGVITAVAGQQRVHQFAQYFADHTSRVRRTLGFAAAAIGALLMLTIWPG